MAINFAPRVGQILQCQFGQFSAAAMAAQGPPDFNRRIPPEMVKNRLVVVLNGRLSRQSSIVVPLSRSQDLSKTHAGVHVEIASDAICDFDYFTSCRRWAKADCVHTVSSRRLMPLTAEGRLVEWVLNTELVLLVQRAAIKALNASALLIPITEQAMLIEGVRPLKSTT